MKILLINYEYPPYGGGAGNATRCIARELVGMGHHVGVVTGGDPNRTKKQDSEDIVEIIRVGSPRKYKDRSNLFEMLSFCVLAGIETLKKRHCRWEASISFFVLPTAPVSWMLRCRWKVPYLVSLRGGDVPGNEEKLSVLHRFLQAYRRLIYRNSAAVIANSQELANQACQADGINVAVVKNGVDSLYFRPPEINREVGDNRALHFLFVGRIQRQKRIPEMVRMLAANKLINKIDFKLEILGDGPERPTVERLVKELKIGSWVNWTRWAEKDQVRKAYWQSHCLINLSSYEGSPNTVLEAMSCGLPVIASDIGPHRELIIDGSTGFLIPLEQSNLFDKRLAFLFENPGELKRMGDLARESVKLQYSWNETAESYLRLLDNDLHNVT